jgi:hypothetical protein
MALSTLMRTVTDHHTLPCRDDEGPVKYGMTVAIRAPSAKER